jgi:putative ABC transport system permease protein
MALRLALRRLAAAPAFTVGVIAILALGSGASFAVFTVVNALVLKRLPVPDPDALVAVGVQNAQGEPTALPTPLFHELVQRQKVFDGVAGLLGGTLVSTDANRTSHQAVVDGVTPDYFRLLGIQLIEGRGIEPADYVADGMDASSVCVITNSYRERVYGAEAEVLGRQITLGETTFTIVGVLSAQFSGIDVGVRTEIVVPAPAVGRIIALPPGSVPMRHVIGRLAPGRSLDEARAELSAIWTSLVTATRARQPSANLGERRLVISPGATGVSTWRARYQGPLHVTMLASAWLLVIACANLAGLQFTRTLRRSRDVAVSRALGARQWDLLSPTLLESTLLCAAGLLMGLPMAAWGARLVTKLLSTGAVPLELDLATDWTTWMVIAATFIVLTVLAGVLPAWLAIRGTLALGPGSRVIAAGGRIGSVLVVGQIALAVTLLTGASLAVASVLEISLRDPGFDGEHVLALQLVNRPGGYTQLDDGTYYRSLVERLTSVPGVSSVALAKPLPGLSGPSIRSPITASSILATSDAAIVVVSPGYFEALRIPLLSGRAFEWNDAEGSTRVAVVSRSLARALSSGALPHGLRMDVGTLPYHRNLEVIGIADDASVLNVRDDAPRVVYLSALQQPPPMARWPGVLVRVRPGAGAIALAIGRVVDDLGHEFVVRTVPLTGQITRSLARERLLSAMAIVYGGLALSMVAIGLWALLAHDVTQRIREFGVRLSLGATPAGLRRTITLRAMRLSIAGSALGAVAAWMFSTALTATFGVDWAASAWTLAGVTGLLLTVAGLAAAGPGRQAARTEPMRALRSE